MKTSELIGTALDWVVAMALKQAVRIEGGRKKYCVYGKSARDGTARFRPSTDWSQGGQIIEREKISLEIKDDGWWLASYQYNYSDTKEHIQLDHNPLIAAMRCYCCAKLGDTVEIPEELK